MARTMKDSGIEWIGLIPEEWEVRKIKQLANKEISDSFIDGDWIESPYITDEGIRYLTTGNIGDGKYKEQGAGYISEETFKALNCKFAYPYDLVFSRLNSPYGRSCILPNDFDRYVLAVDNVILRPTEDISKRYICYMSQCGGFQHSVFDFAKGTTMKRISRSNLGNIWVVIPSKSEQDKIADFLDEKIGEVDTIISKTKASIEEYKKYKQAVITETITHGLDKSVEIVDTDNVHMSSIPAHWKMKKIKYVFEIKKDIAGKEGYDILSITQKGIKVKDISKNEGQLAQSYANYQLVDIGDFAMNHMDLLTGWVDISKYVGVTSPDYRVFRFIDNVGYSANYYLYLMQMCYMNRIFYGLGQGVSNLGRWRLQADKFLNFTIPVPPLDEQEEIAEYLDAKCGEIDALIAKKEAFVEEMEAYKKSVIYEYVTGKKEVL